MELVSQGTSAALELTWIESRKERLLGMSESVFNGMESGEHKWKSLPITLEQRKAEGKPLVLVVDDDPLHHKLMELLADRLGITVHLVSSCGQAVDALSLFSFDLILMDYM